MNIHLLNFLPQRTLPDSLTDWKKAFWDFEQMPERFRTYEEEPLHSRGLRIMPVDNFVILYIPDAKRGIVTVIRVMYGGRDINAELWEHTNNI